MPVDNLELAQAAAITLTAAHAGLVTNSILVVNAFTHHPTIETVKIWRRVYLRGKPLNMAVAATSCSLWSYLAYHTRDQRTSRLYATCAAIIPTCIAFFLVIQKPVDVNLLETASSDKTDPGRIRRLFDTWYKMAAVRAAIMGAAAVTGVWATVSKPRVL